MRKVIISIALIIFAASEVAATGVLYGRLGLYDLVLIYVVTTAAGALVLLSQSMTMKAIAREMSKRSKNNNLHEQLQSQLSGGDKSEAVQEWSAIAVQGALYTFAWVLVLIPGLVTDVAGFGLIGVWFTRKGHVSSML